MTDIAREIWRRCAEGRPYDTAEQRVAIDRALRAELSKINDINLRGHAAQMIRHFRYRWFRASPRGRLRHSGALARGMTRNDRPRDSDRAPPVCD